MNKLQKAELLEQVDNYGLSTLSMPELFSLIFPKDQVDSREIIDNIELNDFLYNSFKDLKNKSKVKDSIILTLLASMEFSKRIFRSSYIKKGTIISSKLAGSNAIELFRNIYQECLVGFFLDFNKKIIKHEIIFKGSLSISIAYPRDIIERAIKYHAHSFILVHNHPSGNLEFSKQDVQFTERMLEATKIMGLEFTDHLIVGNDKYLSMREEKILE